MSSSDISIFPTTVICRICIYIATQQPHVSAYTGKYQMRCTAYKVAPDDGLIYEGRTESHEQLFFACEVGTADEG